MAVRSPKYEDCDFGDSVVSGGAALWQNAAGAAADAHRPKCKLRGRLSGRGGEPCVLVVAVRSASPKGKGPAWQSW
jgi:hypothetical protein